MPLDLALQQGNEADGGYLLAFPAILPGPDDARELLHPLVADGHDQPSADRQLLAQRAGHLGALRGDEDGIERSRLRQPLHPVACDDRAIVVSESGDPFGGLVGERVMTLDRENRLRDPRENCGGVARPRTHFQNAIMWADPRRLDHAGHDIGLGNRLPLTDRQRLVAIGIVGEVRRDESVPRDRLERSQYGRAPDPAITYLARHHSLALLVDPLPLDIGHLHAPSSAWFPVRPLPFDISREKSCQNYPGSGHQEIMRRSRNPNRTTLHPR